MPGRKGTEIGVFGKWQGGQLGRHQGGMARQARGLETDARVLTVSGRPLACAEGWKQYRLARRRVS